jgi:hypothetical protein
MSRQLREHVLSGIPHVQTSPTMSEHQSSMLTMSTDMSRHHREHVLPKVLHVQALVTVLIFLKDFFILFHVGLNVIS